MSYLKVGNLQVANVLYEFVNQDVLPGTGLAQAVFWDRFEQLFTELIPENHALLKSREEIQKEIDQWHKQHRQSFQRNEYRSFLEEIGYLEKEVEDYEVTTTDVDDEIVVQAGPQLVVPVNNARYAINAANARWGSLYDALYGTNAISSNEGAQITKPYNPIRGQKVIEFAKQFLDDSLSLVEGSHTEVVAYKISNSGIVAKLESGKEVALKNPQQFVGYQGDIERPAILLFKNNGLHFELQIDRDHPVGQTDKAGLKDIMLESALTTIMDFEDSVAAVDAEDKVEVYRNWLGLVKGDLEASFFKGGKERVRTLNEDRQYLTPEGNMITLPGRSLMFVRNVGHLMTNSAILTADGYEVPEGIMDGVITALISKHDLLGNGRYSNSKKGSIYIVKPKMHGSQEVAFANKLFNRIEDLVGLKRYTIKIGVMDEERRTSLNLKNCIYEVKNRIVFINTGFLDRTGDEIHTSMEAGVMIRKNEMKSSIWLNAYELSNVYVGLSVGMQGHAQIGKGMWAMPDLMAEMMDQKINHLKAGANTAWVPSPTAATLHALHYHQIDVKEVQDRLQINSENLKDSLLQFPIANKKTWSEEDILEELENNAQSILGYVVRWIDQGIGCSKVPDINNVGLMEDRATLRISSQHMANWLHHGICTKEQVQNTLKRMAKVVDEQNANDPNYRSMSNNYDDSVAFQAACELIFEGKMQPSGYTEPILHRRRIEAKQKQMK